jgi:hypothetical protein
MQHTSTLTGKKLIPAPMKRYAICCGRTLTPSLVLITFAAAAHAQGTIDFSGSTTMINSVKTFAIYFGSVVCFIALIFAGIKFFGRDIAAGFMGLGGALFGAGILGWGAGWISSLTGQSVQ